MEKNEMLVKRFYEKNFKGELTKKKAIELAYADMSRRATGHTKQMKNVCVKCLVEEVFDKPFTFKSQEEFDDWHKKICEKLSEKLNTVNESFGRVGRAQKVINMAFKYLSYVDDTYDKVLPYCHMTLDSYTLEWYKSINKKWKRIEWSKIDNYDDYYSIQDYIRKYLDRGNVQYCICVGEKTTEKINLPNSPFEAEYIIWEGEKINSRYSELTKSLKTYRDTDRKNDEWLIGNLFDEVLAEYI